MSTETEVSATDVARRFSDTLDEVEHEGRVFVINRRGRAVALLTPLPNRPATRRTWGEAIRIMLAGPAPDDEFEKDLKEIRASVGPMPPDPWERS
jgi:prevent-host-death family protein